MMNFNQNNWNAPPTYDIHSHSRSHERDDNIDGVVGEGQPPFTNNFDDGRQYRQGPLFPPPPGGYNPAFQRKIASENHNDDNVNSSPSDPYPHPYHYATANQQQQHHHQQQSMNPMMVNEQYQQQSSYENPMAPPVRNPDIRHGHGVSQGNQQDSYFDCNEGQQQSLMMKQSMMNHQMGHSSGQLMGHSMGHPVGHQQQMHPQMNQQMHQQMGQQRQQQQQQQQQSMGMGMGMDMGMGMGMGMNQQMGQQQDNMNFPATQTQQGSNPIFQRQFDGRSNFTNNSNITPSSFSNSGESKPITPERNFGQSNYPMSHKIQPYVGSLFFPAQNKKRNHSSISHPMGFSISKSSSSEEGEKQQVDNPEVVCRCVKSRCLKLYCDCFQSNLLCNTLCKCVQCLNTETENKKGGRLKRAKRDYLLRKPKAFGKKPDKSLDYCSCKNNRCLKKYCYCFRNKISCTQKCLCMNCGNQDIHKMKNSSKETDAEKETQADSEKESLQKIPESITTGMPDSTNDELIDSLEEGDILGVQVKKQAVPEGTILLEDHLEKLEPIGMSVLDSMKESPDDIYDAGKGDEESKV